MYDLKGAQTECMGMSVTSNTSATLPPPPPPTLTHINNQQQLQQIGKNKSAGRPENVEKYERLNIQHNVCLWMDSGKAEKRVDHSRKTHIAAANVVTANKR